jgi:hypothetical protein
VVWRGTAVRFGFLLIVLPLGSLAGISLRKRLATPTVSPAGKRRQAVGEIRGVQPTEHLLAESDSIAALNPAVNVAFVYHTIIATHALPRYSAGYACASQAAGGVLSQRNVRCRATTHAPHCMPTGGTIRAARWAVDYELARRRPRPGIRMS